SAANISVSDLSLDNHTITASYGGDNNYLTSTGTVIQTVNAGARGGPPASSPVSPATSLFISAAAVQLGQPIVLIATVSFQGSSGITGSVTFFDLGMPLATVPLNGTVLAFNIATLPPGQHALSAAYDGDANHTGSSSSAVTVTVGTFDEQFVGKLYQTVLQRQPDAGGLAVWTAALNHGFMRSQVAQAIEK